MGDPADEMRECPFCAETIRAKAVKCKHCRSVLSPFSTAPVDSNTKVLTAAENDSASNLPASRSSPGRVIGVSILAIAAFVVGYYFNTDHGSCGTFAAVSCYCLGARFLYQLFAIKKA